MVSDDLTEAEWEEDPEEPEGPAALAEAERNLRDFALSATPQQVDLVMAEYDRREGVDACLDLEERAHARTSAEAARLEAERDQRDVDLTVIRAQRDEAERQFQQAHEGWAAEVSDLRAQLQATAGVTAALADALEGMEEMLPYVPEYFVEKHELSGYVDRARAALATAVKEASSE